MIVRPAHTTDARAICELVNHYAERRLMLHRSLESIYDGLREFHVAVDDEVGVVGCVAVDIFWADLAEVKSLAVSEQWQGRGVGGRLLDAAMEDARAIGIRRLFALTYEKDFFLRRGFAEIERETLPEKVWRECIACAKVDACDEWAVMALLEPAQVGAEPPPAAPREVQEPRA